MKLRNRILSIFAIVVALAFVSLAVTLSYTAPCGAPESLPAGNETMKGIVMRCYGAPDVLKLEQVAKPTPTDDQLLVKVHAAALNPVDWHYMRGSPYIMRLSSGIGAPSDPRVGVDFAGTVEAVGKNVTRFKPGDEVFGGADGAVAEYVVVRETRGVALKPANVTFEQAGSVGVAALTALQGLRDHGGIKPGQKVLINGASGGVGTFAVQLAKHFGAEVTGVCSTRERRAGALARRRPRDRLHAAGLRGGTERYDIVLDNVANRSLSDLRHVLKPTGTIVIVGGAKGNWIGPLWPPLKAAMLQPFVDQMGMFIAKLGQEDLQLMGELMQAGKVTAVIDRRYAFSEAAKAMEYLEAGRARGDDDEPAMTREKHMAAIGKLMVVSLFVCIRSCRAGGRRRGEVPSAAQRVRPAGSARRVELQLRRAAADVEGRARRTVPDARGHRKGERGTPEAIRTAARRRFRDDFWLDYQSRVEDLRTSLLVYPADEASLPKLS